MAPCLRVTYHISKAKAREIILYNWNTWLFCQLSTRVFSSATIQKYQFSIVQAFFVVQLSHPYMTTGKTLTLTMWTFVEKVTSLLLICCLGLSQLFSQGANVFYFMAAVIITVILEPKLILVHFNKCFANTHYM